MKRILVGIFALSLLFCFVGCANTENYPQGINNNQQNTVNNADLNSAPTEIVLTTENIYEFLTISLDVTDVEKKYLGADCSVAEGKLTVKTAPRKRGDFDNVTIQVTLNTTSGGWEADGKWETREKSLIIPFDGKFEDVFKIRSNVTEDFITTSPRFEIIINSVSGTFIQ